MSSLSAPGEFPVKMQTGTITLRCSIKAMRAVNAVFGNFYSAQDRIKSSDFAAYCVVVAAGLDKEPREVEADVYGTGMIDLNKPLCEFLDMLANGGRPPNVEPANGAAPKNA